MSALLLAGAKVHKVDTTYRSIPVLGQRKFAKFALTTRAIARARGAASAIERAIRASDGISMGDSFG